MEDLESQVRSLAGVRGVVLVPDSYREDPERDVLVLCHAQEKRIDYLPPAAPQRGHFSIQYAPKTVLQWAEARKQPVIGVYDVVEIVRLLSDMPSGTRIVVYERIQQT